LQRKICQSNQSNGQDTGIPDHSVSLPIACSPIALLTSAQVDIALLQELAA
jgi:hypothetical protein